MAGLRRVGTQLVASGAPQYISAMQRAAQATTGIGKAAEEGGRGLDTLNAKSATLAVTAGNLLAGAIQKATGFMVQQTQAAVGTVVAHERMVMSLGSLVARELKTADATLSMSAAMEQATPRAEELLKWIQQLAIKSPFDQEGVAMAFKTAQVYGFTTTQAQKLTQTLIDFAAATGKSSAVINQLAFPLGQIKNTGKALTLDLRQLTNAGVDVTAILKSMGQGWEDVSAGAVKSDEFIMAFVETLDRDFGGAAARSTNTLGGLLNSLEDIQDMATRALFTPIFQAITPHIATFADKLQELIPFLELVGQSLGRFTAFLIENRAAIVQLVAVIGAMVAGFITVLKWGSIVSAVAGGLTGIIGGLGSAFLFLTSPLGLAAAAVAALAGAFALIGVSIRKAQQEQEARMQQMTAAVQSQTMVQASITEQMEQRRLETMGEFGDKIIQQQAQQHQETAVQSRSWGENIIIQFAQGMANAISAVIQVLTEVGNVIASWMAPGSPPKFLPDINKWGVGAMNEYLRGFASADFSLFNDLARTIEGHLRTLDMPEENVVPAILKARSAVSALVDEFARTGTIGEQAFDRLFDSIRITDPALRGYTRALFDVQMAQEKLNAVTAKYDEMLRPLQGELAGIQKKRQQFIDNQRKAELKDILKRARLEGNTEAAMLAQMELREIELKNQIGSIEERRDTEVSAAQAEVDAAQETLAAQQALVDVQTENNRLIQEQIRLLERLADKMSKLGGAAGKAPKIPKGKGGPLAGLGDALSGLGADMGAGLGGGMNAAIENLKGRLTSLVEEIKAPFANIGAQIIGLGQTWAPVWDGVRLKVTEAWAVVKPVLDQLNIDLGDVAKGAIYLLGVFIVLRSGLAIAGVVGSLIGVLGTLKGVLVGVGVAVAGVLGVLGAPFFIAAGLAIGAVGLLIMETGGIIPALNRVKETFSFLFGPSGLMVQVLNLAAAKLATWIQETSDRFAAWITRTSQGIVDWTNETSETFVNWVNDTITNITQFGRDMVTKITQMWTDIKTEFDTAKTSLELKVTSLIDNIKAFFTNTNWAQLGLDIITGLVRGINDNAQQVINAISSMATAAWDQVKAFFGIDSPSRLMMMAGADIGRGLALGLMAGVPSVAGAAQSLAAAASPIQPPASPSQITTNNNTTNFNNFQGVGTVNAAGGMDVAVIEAIVDRTVRRALQ